MEDLTLVVMAAGMGSRYGGLKQMEPVGPSGEAIIDYSVFDAVKAGFSKVVFVIRPDMERDFRQLVGRRVERHVDTACAFQELCQVPGGIEAPAGRTKPWGTGHAVLAARGLVRGPFAVVNADDFYGASSFAALSAHLRSIPTGAPPPHEHCMVGYSLGNTVSDHGSVARGLCEVSPDGFLTGIRELTKVERGPSGIRHVTDGGATIDLAAGSVVSMNMWGFDPRVLDELASRFSAFLAEHGRDLEAEYFLPSVIMDLLSQGVARVRVLPTDERWVGVTHRADLEGVRQLIAARVSQRIYPPSLWG